MTNAPIRLTQYAHGSGCGCKIAPAVLQEIIGHSTHAANYPGLLVGNHTNDDAAVIELENNQCLVATTDFFTPVVDDAFDFGRIAAANAISDVYAMGGKPLLALAILGWPVDTLPAAIAAEVLKGARQICDEVGIPLAGGHSIDTREPIFGLSVNGLVQKAHIKRNSTAKSGNLLYLTRPIGTGVLSAALKRGLIREEEKALLTQHMCTVNKVGLLLATHSDVSAMTDVTGFGIAGHLLEMSKSAGLTAEIHLKQLPVLPGVTTYIGNGVMPDATFRNWNAFSPQMKVDVAADMSLAFSLLPDPQTNGGLLFSCTPESAPALISQLVAAGYAEPAQIGRLLPASDTPLRVLP